MEYYIQAQGQHEKKTWRQPCRDSRNSRCIDVLVLMRKFSFPSHLDVCVPRCPEQVGDPGPAHCSGDGLAGRLDTGQQLGEVT